MDYWRKAWACPFFKWDDAMKLGCDGGVMRFPDRQAAVEFMDNYCANVPGFMGCSIEKALEEHYERTNSDDEERHDQDAPESAGA